MLKVVFKQDGSIIGFQLPSYVNQGSHGELDSLRLEVAVRGRDISDLSVFARFRMPNGMTSTIEFENDTTVDLYGVPYPNGKYAYLTEAETYYAGMVLCSIIIKDGTDTLYTYPCHIVVNETSYDPDSESNTITNAQYDNLVEEIDQIENGLSSGTIVQYDTYDELVADLSNLQVGRLAFAKDSEQFYKILASGETKYADPISNIGELIIDRENVSVNDGTLTDEQIIRIKDGGVAILKLRNLGNNTYIPFSLARMDENSARFENWQIGSGSTYISIKYDFVVTGFTGSKEWLYRTTEYRFYSKNQADAALDLKQDVLTAGAGITITGSTISATTAISLYYAASVADLPATGSTNVIYMVNAASTDTRNNYDEYIWDTTNERYERIGTVSTDVDLSGYLPTYAQDSSKWDTTPTANSTKPVTSGGLKTAIDKKTIYHNHLWFTDQGDTHCRVGGLHIHIFANHPITSYQELVNAMLNEDWFTMPLGYIEVYDSSESKWKVAIVNYFGYDNELEIGWCYTDNSDRGNIQMQTDISAAPTFHFDYAILNN